MKKVFIAAAFLLGTGVAVAQQIAERPKPRPFTQPELQYWESVCSAFEQAIPRTFKNYEVRKDDCHSFDWTERDKNGHSLTVENTKGEPIGNVPNFTITYTKREEDLQEETNAFLLAIQNANGDAAKIQAAGYQESRMNGTKELRLFLIANYHAKRDIEEQYAITTKPQKLPVLGASFAMLYTLPADKAMLVRGGLKKEGAEQPQKLCDNALIIFGNPPKVTTDPADDNVTFAIDRVYTQDAVTNITTQPTKNVVVMITGDEADIHTLIGMINWKAIAAMRKM